MGGSFESGAGDSPDDLFGSAEEEPDESEEAEQADQRSETAASTAPAKDPEQAESTTEEQAESTAEEQNESEPETTESSPTEQDVTASTSEAEVASESTAEDVGSVLRDVDRSGDFDAAGLAQEFVPANYDKPHPWALGRDGVNDGRPEKKTFFLQSEVLDLEEACRDEVNDILDGDVPLTDLRELALIVAYHQPELLAEAAREWGSESA